MVRLPAPLTPILTAELDGAAENLRVPVEAILLAALGRMFARTIGDGVVVVDLPGQDRSVPLACSPPDKTSATQMLAETRQTLTDAPVEPQTVRRVSEVGFSYGRALPASEHALELLAYRGGGVLQLDWRYDPERFNPYTVEEFSEQFPLALIELTSEAVPQPDKRRPERRRRRTGFAPVIRIDGNGTDPAITGEPSEEQLK